METLKKYILANNYVISVKVLPKSEKNDIFFDKKDILKIKIKEIPENDKANKFLICFLSKELDIPQKNISILKGRSTKNKILKIIL